MSRDWETQFAAWATPPGQTEQQRCDNAEGAIRNAINASASLSQRGTRVFTHGSYANRVNVRKDSDVDVGILCDETMYPTYPDGMDASSFDLSDATYHYPDFKKDILDALAAYFGTGAVTRGNKAIDVHETSYHVEADVVPLFEHRRYAKNGDYLSGVALCPDSGWWIVNWPEQHYRNGVDKNTRTNRRYKGIVRIMKSLRNEMADNQSPSAPLVSGFFIECCCWNLPDSTFDHDSWHARVQSALSFLWSATQEEIKCSEWGEVSELKYLFRPDSRRIEAHSFFDASWDYVGVG